MLAAVRSLHGHGWQVGVSTPSPRSLVAVSRRVTNWHPLTSDVVGSVAAAVAERSYDVVLPGGDAELFALSEGRTEVGCAVPYGSRESVRCILDKLTMTSQAARFGLQVPETREATDAALRAVSEVVVLKSASHVAIRSDTLVSADQRELRKGALAMRAAGVQPLLQEHTTGPLVALSVVIGPDGEVLAAVQQRATALWPPEAGISVRAQTVPVEPELLTTVAAFLDGIGWRGLAELQFIEAPDGPRLIDVNGRCYGSMALAAAAGVDLAAVWADSATGAGGASGPAVVGVRYQWLYGDLRRGWRTGHDLLGPLAHSRRAAHSVWDRRDLRPSASYLGALMASLVRAVVP